jgi:hypothetical protein
MSTVLCERSNIGSAVEKLRSKSTDAKDEYRALLDRLVVGGSFTAGDGVTLLLAGKSEDDLTRDLETAAAQAADLGPAREAEEIRRELLPAARQQATRAAAEFQSRFDATRLFVAALFKELEKERAKAANFPGYLDSLARELGSGPNSTALHVRRERAKVLLVQQAQRQPMIDSDIHAEAGRRCLAAGAANELEQLTRPFVPVALPTLEPIELRDLAAIVTAAVGTLTDAQRRIMRDLGTHLLEATTEKLA